MSNQAKITIQAGEVQAATINPYVFGHFVEDIRDHMDAMLAFVLKDMDFEDEAVGGVSSGWYPINNGKNTRFELEPAAPKHSGHSQKIRIYSSDQCTAGIGQRISVRGGMEYRIRLVARAALDIRELVCEVADAAGGKTLCSAQVELTSHNWREYTFTVTPAETAENAEFRLLISSEGAAWPDSIATGILWLDHVSMLPADSRGIVKKEVIDWSRELNAGMMRLAGNYISAYHFEHAIGPELERPNMINEAWGGWTNKYFGTDEFIRFCRDLNVEPLICVNAGSGTPEEAVQWMEYCNGGKDTPFGARRIEYGNEEPFGVKYWEIGNEIYGPWQVGHCSAEEFAHRYVRFAKAMKAADPNIILMACGDVNSEWNKTVLDIAGEYIDYLTLHIYHGFGTVGIDPNTPKEERYKAMVAYPEITRHIVNETTELIRSSAKHEHVKLAITEYTTMYYPNTIRKGLPMEHTLESAVANAANLNEYIRQASMVEIGSYSDLVNGWLAGCIRVGDHFADQYRGKQPGWSGKSQLVYGTPTYHMMKVYANRDIARTVTSAVDCGTFGVTPQKNRFGVKLDELPVLDVVSCLSESGDTLTLFVVNRGLEPVQTEISVDAFMMSPDVTMWEISGDDYEAINSVFAPDYIVSKQKQLTSEQGRLTCSLNAHSIYVLEMKRRNR
ncbi:alpha-L-arabinofuranosidase C-terminal domain-containing protein [Paenibacillus thalictri]|uniref:non-reducing end alpha-L-arabinofuranosidase n=1 Tax=Paenibacillus thalictri TaxID=2527873 RepID=A0A4Q9DIN8_9BACL|nr:alpha-L-arabinofuranosidase C-terminal domain-containing protein [Paenibacillus thalictri]TBL73234.1 alpha-L-arabinofuranosidase [Paenibacillus thalictri]